MSCKNTKAKSRRVKYLFINRLNNNNAIHEEKYAMSKLSKWLIAIFISSAGFVLSLPAFASVPNEVVWLTEGISEHISDALIFTNTNYDGYTTDADLCGAYYVKGQCSIKVNNLSIINATTGSGTFYITTYVVSGVLLGPPFTVPDEVVAQYFGYGQFSLITASGSGVTQTAHGNKNVSFSYTGAGMIILSPYAAAANYAVNTILEVDSYIAP